MKNHSWRCFFLALLLALPPWIPARSEGMVFATLIPTRPPYSWVGRVELPDFSPAQDWVAPRPISDEADAIAYARQIFGLPLLGVNADQAQWSAEADVLEESWGNRVDRRSIYVVTGELPDESLICITLYADHGGVRALQGPGSEVCLEDCAWEGADSHSPWRAELQQYAAALLKAMEPGISQHFNSLTDAGDYILNGARFVSLEFWQDPLQPDASMGLLLQVYPTLRLVSVFTSIG